MLQALLLAVSVMTGHIRIGHIMMLATFLGLINAFDTPIRQAFTAELIEKKEDLGNAIALNSAMFNGARLLGPTIAGLLIAVFGEGYCFLLNGLSYLAVIAALLRRRIPFAVGKVQKQKLMKGLKEGFFYSFGFAPIRAVLFLLMAVSIMGMPYMVLMPVFAKDILHGGSHTLGFLMGAASGGALCGALYLAQRKNSRRPRTRDSADDRTVQPGTDRFCAGASSMVVLIAPFHYRIWADGPDGFKQHHFKDHRRRR